MSKSKFVDALSEFKNILTRKQKLKFGALSNKSSFFMGHPVEVLE